MGNAAAVQSVSESARRRLLLQQHNARPDVLVSRSVLLAFQRRRQPAHIDACESEPSVLLPLRDIFDVLGREFRVCCSLEELPSALEQLGCRLVTANSENLYSVAPLVDFIAPRRILRQVKRPAQPTPGEQSNAWGGLTVWQAAKGGSCDVIRAICERHKLAFRAFDAFENTPLYYASLCGREEAVSALMMLYERANEEIPADELLRCVTNALNSRVRALLQRKTTLDEALALRKKEEMETEEDDNDGFFLAIVDDDDPY